MRLTFNQIKTAIENAGLEARSYSGRCMYGKNCIGVDVDDFTDLGGIIAGLEDPKDGDGTFEDGTDMAADLFKGMRSDGMGLGIIIYWPNIDWEGEEEEENEDDE